MRTSSGRIARFKNYVLIIRADHWFKNLILIPGVVAAWVVTQPLPSLGVTFYGSCALAFFLACLTASANYIINELTDAEFDRFHPIKKHRFFVHQHVNPVLIYVIYGSLITVSLILAALWLSFSFMMTLSLFSLCGILYNIRPFRLKDRAYLDALLESLNTVFRLLLGWFVVSPHTFPPISLMISFWMGGAFLMTIKRYAEFRSIGNPVLAIQYRKSFMVYTEDRLLSLSLFYALLFAFTFAFFIYHFRLEYVLMTPWIALIFAWYFYMGIKTHLSTQEPVVLYRETYLILILLVTIIGFIILSFVNIPSLYVMV